MIASAPTRVSPGAPSRTRSVGRLLTLLAALLLATAFMWTYLGSASSASAAVNGSAVEQCNGLFSGGGEGAECTVQVENFLDLATSAESSIVTVSACRGSFNDPTASCVSGLPETFPFVITAVNQCNDAANGGGSKLTCSVAVINTITGDVTPTAASIRQCNDATAPLIVCTPIGNTTDATIEQCNNSTAADGAGSTLTCTVDSSSTQTGLTGIPVSIDQCNYSGNGNGSLVTCSSSITHRILPAAVVTPPSATPTPETTEDTTSPTPSPVATSPGGGGNGEGAGEGGGSGEELAATGPESTATIALGAVMLLFAGSLVLLARNLRRKPTSTSSDLHTTR